MLESLTILKGMKILFVNVLEPRHGSTHRARHLSKLLRAYGHTVHYCESNSDLTRGVISVRQHASPWGFARATLSRLLLTLTSDYELLAIQKALPLGLPCLVIGRLRGKKVLVDFDDVDSQWMQTTLRKRLTAFSENWMPRWANLVTTHNRYLARLLMQRSRRAVRTVPQGVDTARFSPNRYGRDVQKARIGVGGRFVFCFLGSFTVGSARDLDVVLEAMVRVARARPDSVLLIVGGEGPLEQKYRDRIDELGLRERVKITGRLPQEEVPSRLAAADVGVVYMRDDEANRMRMSLKLLEYLSMELPVVGHLVGESLDALGRFCSLCRPGSDSLAAAMVRVAEAPGANIEGRRYVSQAHDWHVVGARLDEALRGLGR